MNDPAKSSDVVAESTSQPRANVLPSGRSVVVKLANGQELLEIRNPDGVMEVQVALTDQGPVVRLQGGRLELHSPDEVAVHCRKFAVHSQEETILQSAGAVNIAAKELHGTTEGAIHLNGEMIYLNCEEVS